jgi:hypothetical protein
MNIFDQSRFNLVLCEIHYIPIHGKTSSSCPTIEGHYILIDKFDGITGIMLDDLEEYAEYDTDEEIDDDDDDSNRVRNISDLQTLYSNYYAILLTRHFPHKTIRNYHNIISQPNYIKPEVAECFELPTGEHIVIIKTIWIKIIQRKWKKIYASRQHIIKCRSCPSSLSTRQLTGKWPSHCISMPGLKGMLSNLLNNK